MAQITLAVLSVLWESPECLSAASQCRCHPWAQRWTTSWHRRQEEQQEEQQRKKEKGTSEKKALLSPAYEVSKRSDHKVGRVSDYNAAAITASLHHMVWKEGRTRVRGDSDMEQEDV